MKDETECGEVKKNLHPLKRRIMEENKERNKYPSVEKNDDEFTDENAKTNATSAGQSIPDKCSPSKSTPEKALSNDANLDENQFGNSTILTLIKTELLLESDKKTYESDMSGDNDENASLLSIHKDENLYDSPSTRLSTPEPLNHESCKMEEALYSPNSNYAKTLLDTPSKSRSLYKTVLTSPLKDVKGKHQLTDDESQENTRTNEKKRKVSNVSDYDQLSDTVKSELCDVHFCNFEAIDLLHNLDTVMDFDDNKISHDVLLPSMIHDNFKQDSDETASDIYKDPPEDPLSITVNDEKSLIDAPDPDDLKKDTKHEDAQYCSVRITRSKVRKKEEDEDLKKTVKQTQEKDITKALEKLEKTLRFSRVVQEALYDFKVKLIHTVPSQHKLEHSGGSCPPSNIQDRLFSEHGPLKKGNFTPKEDEIIKQNWQKFCEVHNWNPKYAAPFVHMAHGKKFYIRNVNERQKFVQFIANGLPWRMLYSVYQRFKKLYRRSDKIYLRYTAEEDRRILDYMEKYRNQYKKMARKFVELGKLLGRPGRSIYLRYKILKRDENHQPFSKVQWTLPLIEEFIKNLLDVSLCEDVRELKDAMIPKPVWQKLEGKIHINESSLRTFWLQQLHMQLFCPEPIYLNDIKIKLIEYIYGKGIGHPREITWRNVAQYFDGCTTPFLWHVFYYLLKDFTAKSSSADFPAMVEYLYHTRIPEIREGANDKFLPRLKYAKGKLTIIDDYEKITGIAT